MSKDNSLKKSSFLEYFRKVPIQKFAAGYIGVSEDTIINWKKDDLDFANCIERAKADFVSEKMNRVRSNEWILERVFKGDFAQRNEVTGKDGKDLPTPILSTHAIPTNNSNKEVASTD